MSFYIRSKSFQLPSEGVHAAVLAAVQDLGLVRDSFGERQKARLVWIVDEAEGGTGKPLLVLQVFRASLHENSNLSKALTAATGSPPRRDSDLEGFVGIQARLTIEHWQGKLRMYANVTLLEKPLPGQHVTIPTGWEPPKIKSLPELGPEEETPPGSAAPATAAQKPPRAEIPEGPFTATDDDVPF